MKYLSRLPFRSAVLITLSSFATCISLAQGSSFAIPDQKLSLEFDEAIALVKAGKAEDAIPKLEMVVRSYPDLYSANFNLGIAYAAGGKYSKAVPYFESAKMLQDKQNIKDPRIYNSLGWAYTLDGKYKKAEETFLIGLSKKEGLSRDSQEKLYNNLGILYLTTGDLEKSKNAFSIADTKLGSSVAKENLQLVGRVQKAK